jgi:N-acetylmuramoyl-L-alanine amidase
MGRHASTSGTRSADRPAGFLASVIERPLRPGDRGILVETLRRMLVRAEVLPDSVPVEVSEALPVFDEPIRGAVRTFQQRRGLVADGVVGRQTAALLMNARWRFGQRTLLHTPGNPMRGDDVAALQERMVVLGVHAGPVDGIFGPVTDASLRELQRGLGLEPDGLCGPATVAALEGLRRSVAGGDAYALRTGSDVEVAGRRLSGKTIALDAATGSDGRGVAGHGLIEAQVTQDVVERLAERLREVGAAVVLTHEPGERLDVVGRAEVAQDAHADLCLSFHCEAHASPLAQGLATFYWGGGRVGQHSAVGHRLATFVQREIVARTGAVDCRSHPCAYDLVRLTRMPAVMVGLGYLTNEDDARRLADPRMLDHCAEGALVAVQRLYLADDEARTGTLNLKDVLARSRGTD